MVKQQATPNKMEYFMVAESMARQDVLCSSAALMNIKDQVKNVQFQSVDSHIPSIVAKMAVNDS